MFNFGSYGGVNKLSIERSGVIGMVFGDLLGHFCLEPRRRSVPKTTLT